MNAEKQLQHEISEEELETGALWDLLKPMDFDPTSQVSLSVFPGFIHAIFLYIPQYSLSHLCNHLSQCFYNKGPSNPPFQVLNCTCTMALFGQSMEHFWNDHFGHLGLRNDAAQALPGGILEFNMYVIWNVLNDVFSSSSITWA